MSITVADILKLPSLKGASVVAGEGGLFRIVSMISVLESVDPTILQDELFHNDEFYGSEIVISGFINAANDIDCQCANIQRLSDGGEVGLIIYYVGIFVPEIDKKVITLANKLNFPIICMPKNRMDLRYSEVICDVMEAIYRSEQNDTSLVTEVLERVTSLPEHQHTVDTVLKMLSDRVKASFLIMDSSNRILNEISWPRSASGMLSEGIESLSENMEEQKLIDCPFDKESKLYYAAVGKLPRQKMKVYIQKSGKTIDEILLKQAVETINLSVNLWSKNHDEVAITELVKAILQDEPLKMRSLADLFHVDVGAINTMWVITQESHDNKTELTKRIQQIKDIMKPFCQIIIADVYEGDLVLLMDRVNSLQETDRLETEVLQMFSDCHINVFITACHNLKNTKEVRSAFVDNKEFMADTRKVFPQKNRFDFSEIQYVKECKDLAQQGEGAISKETDLLKTLLEKEEELHLKETISVYMLDGKRSVTTTAELLHVHKNTVKYRLQKVADYTGFHIGNMTEALALYRAAVMDRLLY